MEAPRSRRGLFTARIISSAQLGILLGVNLGLGAFLLTRTYVYALILGIIFSILAMIVLAPWRRIRLFEEKFSLRLLIPSSRAARFLPLICCVDSFIWGGIFAFVYVLAPSHLGAVESDIGLARTLTTVLAIPLNIFFAAVSDKIRLRSFFLALSEIISVPALFCYALLRSPISIIIFGSLMGFVAASWGPIVIALFTEITPKEELGATLSSWSILTGVSGAIYPIIGGFIISRFGIAPFFMLSGASLMILAITILILLKGY